MSDVLPFILARYNYWIVIVLMMTGLYIVFSRGNLVKTVVGLNIFQTSVFIFYITLGKVAGGTAPILVGGHGEEHGGGHNEEHGGGHDAPHSDDHGAALSPEEALAYVSGERANEVGDLAAADLPTTPNAEGLHDAPYATREEAMNHLRSVDPKLAEDIEAFSDILDEHPGSFVMEGTLEDAEVNYIDQVEVVAHGAAPPADAALDIIYSNPLPHVLILTAIVVGVATTAVGLAIAVRIREAYGTVEEDALERMDNEASGYPEGQPTA